jgi:hypothetical protein
MIIEPRIIYNQVEVTVLGSPTFIAGNRTPMRLIPLFGQIEVEEDRNA